jgi:RNA polymerase sigma factor (sigma-70 family)
MAEFPPTRASLLVRLRDQRDEQAWRQFIDLYTPMVYRYARKQGLQDADAADLSQEVLRVVAGAIGRLEYDPDRGAFRNWLFTIVRQRLSNWRRAQRVRLSGSGDSATHRLLEECPAEAQEAQWQNEWQDRLFARACEQVRRDVNDATWQAFWKTAMEGRRGQEVAADLGMSIAAVYLARRRVLARLKELVQSAEES